MPPLDSVMFRTKTKRPVIFRPIEVNIKCVPEWSKWIAVLGITAVIHLTMPRLITEHCYNATHIFHLYIIKNKVGNMRDINLIYV